VTETHSTHRSKAAGCYSEFGKLSKVVMCSPRHFEILEPINYTQWLYSSNGLPKPRAQVMREQHDALVERLREEGVEVELLEPVAGLPYQHATRDAGVVVGDTVVLSSLRERTRRLEADIVRPVLEGLGMRVVEPDRGFVEGGDVFVDGPNKKLWVGIGARTDKEGVDFLDRTFGHDFDVVPLHFDSPYTHLDTVFGLLGRGHAIVYEPALSVEAMDLIRRAYSPVVTLTEEEQERAGANVLCLDADRVIAIAENRDVNQRISDLGYQVIELSFSEIIKSGGSVRCDTLPVERS
jgi:N-dimethylarginine dimethylaminohydrolase